MDIRLIAFDLDGTLLRSDKSISPRTVRGRPRRKKVSCSFRRRAVYTVRSRKRCRILP